jgi:hypothetical protein
MLTHLIAILSLAVLCGAWVAFQRWLHKLDPELPGLDRSCSGGCGACKDKANQKGCASQGGRGEADG